MTLTKLIGIAGIVLGIVAHQTATSTHWAQLVVVIIGAVLYVVDHIRTVITDVIADSTGMGPPKKPFTTTAMEHAAASMIDGLLTKAATKV